MGKKSKRINTFVYYFSLLTWIVNIALIILPFFLEISGFWIVGILVSVFIQGIVSGAFRDETLVPKTSQKHQAIDYCLIVSKYISVSLAAFGFVSLLIAGGGPEIMDETYCVVDHGKVVRQISEGWYMYLVVCESFFYTCSMLRVSTWMALRMRALYLINIH